MRSPRPKAKRCKGCPYGIGVTELGVLYIKDTLAMMGCCKVRRQLKAAKRVTVTLEERNHEDTT